MKERPILFSTEMVQAILEGQKTQTRREFKLKHCNKKMSWANEPYSIVNDVNFKSQITGEIFIPKNAYGLVGDVLWVRETWCIDDCREDMSAPKYLYKADFCGGVDKYDIGVPSWKPSTYMPKDACRLRLKIISIRIERLLDISEQDAIAEGIFRKDIEISHIPQWMYFSLWDKINGIDSHKQNPWVWVIEFERII